MVPITYLNKVRSLLDHLEKTQLDAVNQAADFVVEAWRTGGVIYCHKFGHGIEGDSIFRAGGLASVKRFHYSFDVESPVPGCRKGQDIDPDLDLKRARMAIGLSNLREHDVMLLSSVSGRNREPVELALACRERKVRVITFSSIAYSSKVKPLHPSGKSLCEAGDINIDIGVPYGDAAVSITGIDTEVMPLSGVAMACSAWMLWGRAMEKAAASGNPPSVLVSQNRDGGAEHNERSMKQYEERGF